MEKIQDQDIVAFAPFLGLFPMEIDLAYAIAGHAENLFGQIYHPQADMWGHRDLVKIFLLAAHRVHEAKGWVLVAKDCLRTVEAQILIGEAPISKANPQWFEEPRMMSPPGMGGHPRGMAIDIAVRDVDMGTCFDSLTPQASRGWTDFPQTILDNRKFLENTMMTAARDLGLPLHPLSNEWWDFRFPADYYNQFAPLHEADLRPEQKMTEKPEKTALKPDVRILEELRRFI